MKHLPFESIYRENFQVVEQRFEGLNLFPHNEQLPILLRAVNLEFYGALPGRLARADHRAQPVDKIALKTAALLFCNCINEARSDGLRFFPLADRNLITRPAIVQQISYQAPQGLCHGFRFYGGEDLCEEIFLSGKRVIFSDHVLQRFNSRVPHNIGADLTDFLLSFFDLPTVTMPVGPSDAIMVRYDGSLLALTFRESPEAFFITTCLTINEMNSLRIELPPRSLNFHYDLPFVRPRIRHWYPTHVMSELYKRWQNKVPLPKPRDRLTKRDWHRVGSWVRGQELKVGHGAGSKIFFVDGLPGPTLAETLPNQTEPRFDELKMYQEKHPTYDWERIFAKRHRETPDSPGADTPAKDPENPKPA